MAAPYICDGPDEDQAVAMITLTADGETLALCGTCIVDWAQGVLQAQAPERLARPPAKPPRARKPPAAAPAADANGNPPAVSRERHQTTRKAP